MIFYKKIIDLYLFDIIMTKWFNYRYVPISVYVTTSDKLVIYMTIRH